MTRTERIKAQEEKVAAAARKLKEMKAAESKEQRKKRTHTLIQVGSIIEVVGIPLDTSRDVLTGAWAAVAKMIQATPEKLAELAATGAAIIEERQAGKGLSEIDKKTATEFGEE